MGFSLKKLAKKALKLGAKVAMPIIARTPVGAAAIQAQKVFKSLGGNAKAAKLGKIEPVSVQAAIAKPAMQLASSRPQAARKLYRGGWNSKERMNYAPGIDVNRAAKARKSSQKAKRTTGKGRTAPSGGLDLKAIAALWRSQGKPGSWQGFIKANPIRK